MSSFLAAHWPQFYALAALLFLSAAFSGSETALFSLRPAALNTCRRRQSFRDRCLLRLHAEIADFLYTILLGNLVVNIVYFAIAAGLVLAAQAELGNSMMVALNIFFLLSLIVAGEVLPKSVGSKLQLGICRLTAVPLLALHRLLAPVCFCLKKVTRYCERALLPAPPPSDPQANMHLLCEHYRNEGVVTLDECDLINTIIDLNDIRVHELMTPRVDMVAVDENAAPEELLALARSSRHSKIPVRGAENDQLIGWVDAREFFFTEGTPDLRSRLRPFIFLSEFSTAENALRAFLADDRPLAVVVDERGADAGILVLTDIIAEIFGEFAEPETPAPELVRQESAGVFMFDSRVSTRALKDIVGTATRMPGVSTIGGLVTALLGRTARIGDEVRLGSLTLAVAAVAHHRPTLVRVSTGK